MNKEELVILIARKTNQPQKHIDRWLKHLTDIMKEALSKHETVRLLGFGTFTVKRRKTRHVIHPTSKQRIEIAAKPVPVFRPARLLRKLVCGEIQIKRKRGRPPKNP